MPKTLPNSNLPALCGPLHPEMSQSLDTLTEVLRELEAPLLRAAEHADEQWQQWLQVPAFLRRGAKAKKLGVLLDTQRQQALEALGQTHRDNCRMVPSMLVLDGSLDLRSLVAVAEA